MKHTTVDLDPNEQTAARYRLYSRAIRIIGMAQISSLQPYLQARMQETLYRHVDARDSTDGMNLFLVGSLLDIDDSTGWTSIQLAPLMRDMAGDMLGLYFFGPKLSAEPEFNWALQRYYSDTVKFGGALQLVPGFVASYAYSRITNQGKALQVLFERLRSAMDSKNPNWDEDKNVKSMTLMQNLIESSRESSYWTPDLLIQAIIGIWFAASHQPWINLHFMFLELCTRPEYVRLIRDEIDAQECLDYTHISKMPILDSFMKESVRLNPLDTMSIRRKALKPFTFSDGRTHVAPGEIACAPAWEIMHNEAKYPNPNAFEGLRFVKDLPLPTSTFASGMRNEPMRGTTLTDASKDFPIWGLGSKVCPGRWHAALVLKMALVQLLKEYDFRLENEGARLKWWWETFQMPYESTRVAFRKRER
ncbi:hypothetical protein MMC30_005570 [Trapelia coarctata]|nr:hypothetical protein [Trapelia coarctata]